MLKWAMRILAMGGAILAITVGTAAWMHRTQGRMWEVVVPSTYIYVYVTPRHVVVGGWLRRQWDVMSRQRYAFAWHPFLTSEIERDLVHRVPQYDVFWASRGFAFAKGHGTAMSSDTEVWCPIWSVFAVLLLPTGLSAGIGWRQRASVGHCANCGYDLRASPERCPECGSTPAL